MGLWAHRRYVCRLTANLRMLLTTTMQPLSCSTLSCSSSMKRSLQESALRQQQLPLLLEYLLTGMLYGSWVFAVRLVIHGKSYPLLASAHGHVLNTRTVGQGSHIQMNLLKSSGSSGDSGGCDELPTQNIITTHLYFASPSPESDSQITQSSVRYQ